MTSYALPSAAQGTVSLPGGKGLLLVVPHSVLSRTPDPFLPSCSPAGCSPGFALLHVLLALLLVATDEAKLNYFFSGIC